MSFGMVIPGVRGSALCARAQFDDDDDDDGPVALFRSCVELWMRRATCGLGLGEGIGGSLGNGLRPPDDACDRTLLERSGLTLPLASDKVASYPTSAALSSTRDGTDLSEPSLTRVLK